jgi:hypothetical protein
MQKNKHALYGLRKNSKRREAGVFNPRIRPTELIGASAPEVCFSGLSFKSTPFPAACLAPQAPTAPHICFVSGYDFSYAATLSNKRQTSDMATFGE